jgi:endonuclease YncB( thermonuclease family)
VKRAVARRFKPRRRGGFAGIATALVLVALLAAVTLLFEPKHEPIAGSARASDGDSLRMGETRIRLSDLDAPELDQTCGDGNGAEWPCGRDARDHLAGLVEGATVRCAPEETDQYGRLVARCETDGEDIGAAMVEAGFAVASFGYLGEQALAQREKRGIWIGPFESPRSWRDTRGRQPDGFDLLGWIRSWL